MPLRTGPPEEGNLLLYRDFGFGSLAKATVIDDRQYRSPIIQGEGDGNLPRPFGGGPQLKETFDESRTMLGADQLAWLKTGLAESDAAVKFIVTRAPGFGSSIWSVSALHPLPGSPSTNPSITSSTTARAIIGLAAGCAACSFAAKTARFAKLSWPTKPFGNVASSSIATGAFGHRVITGSLITTSTAGPHAPKRMGWCTTVPIIY